MTVRRNAEPSDPSRSSTEEPNTELSDSADQAKPRAALRGAWFLSSQGDKTEARHLRDGRHISVEGSLQDSAWGAGETIRQLGIAHEDFRSLGESLKEPARALTLDHLLRGENGWGVLFLELTGRCNESCSHCYAQSSPSVETALDWPTIEAVIRDALDLGFQSMQFIGGEPLISPHIRRAVELAAELKSPKIEVFTNGLALNASLIELFVKHGVYLAFSLYSHSAEVHDRVTKTAGSHERTSRAIRAAVEAGLRVRVAGVEGCTDDQDEAKLRQYIVDLGVDEDTIRVDRQRPVGRGVWTPETKLLPSNRGAGHVDKGFPGRAKLCVMYDGSVVPCIFDRATALGDVRRQSLKEIMSKEARLGPASALNVVGEPLACRDCRARRAVVQQLTWEQ